MSTEAGRSLFTRHVDCVGVCEVWSERDAINAIEAEARAGMQAWTHEMARQKNERIERLRAALKEIVALDYRGNEPTEQRIARVALQEDGDG